MPVISPDFDEAPLTAVLGDEELGPLRRELVSYAYRMLGSPFDAEDAVQETMLRASRLAPLRPSAVIASHVDLRHRRQRLPGYAPRQDAQVPGRRHGPLSQPGTELGTPLAADGWLEPFPESLPSGEADPANVATAREGVQLVFVAVLQQLPLYPRSVLIFRDVLGWRANKVAKVLSANPTWSAPSSKLLSTDM